MPTWNNIEDASLSPERIWFSQSKYSDPWIPLRKCDCRALNQSSNGSYVSIECGRAIADKKKGEIIYKFSSRPRKQLKSAIWFEKHYNRSDKRQIILLPISAHDETQIENFYQEAIQATSSLGNGLRSVLKKRLSLENKDYIVVICRSHSGLYLKKRPKSNSPLSLEAHIELQRGYGEFQVDGEIEELSLGPVRYVFFVIHGIGEALWSREDVQFSSIVEEVDKMRIKIFKKQYEKWRSKCLKVKGDEKPPTPPNKIEFIAIEWYDQIHNSSSAVKQSINSITLENISKLRVLANDVVSDVLMYMTPEYCEKVLNFVIEQICNFYQEFQQVHSNFFENGGKCLLMGHSLGSVIAWDILAILKDQGNYNKTAFLNDQIMPHLSTKIFHTLSSTFSKLYDGKKANVGEYSIDLECKKGNFGPCLTKRIKKTIPFVPDAAFFLGSPLGLFLTLRGAHFIFNQMHELITLENQDKENLDMYTDDLFQASPFHLPSGRIYNIFHPSDPVAYRIEPLLLPLNTPSSLIPPPCYLLRGGVNTARLHIKAKELSETIYETFSGIFKATLDKLPLRINVKDKLCIHSPMYKFSLGGNNHRVDFQLQTGVIENEYLAAITAHNSYFSNNDIQEFLAYTLK